jgi:hypothetical protein
MLTAIDEIAAERQRQGEDEGWSPAHDDQHVRGEMAHAAACYCYPPMARHLWPWDYGWWKPRDTRRNLIRAGALILAEIERLDRADGNAAPRGEQP